MSTQIKSKTTATTTAQPLPRKFFPLLWYLVKKTLATVVKQLPRMLIFGILGWLFHTFLMVFVNEGFGSGTLIGGLLATQGNSLGGTVVWTIASGFIFSWLSQAKQKKGKARFAMPPLKTYFSKAGDLALAALVAAAGIAMVIGTAVSSTASIVLAAGIGALLLSQGRAVLSLLIRSAWTSTYGLVQNKKVAQFGMAAGYVAIIGGALGFVLNALIPLAMIKAVIGIALLAAAFYLTKQSGKTVTTTVLFIAGFIGLIYLLNATPIFAHDGGWKEAGGDFIRWIRSQGALEAIIRGLGPGLGILLGPAIVQMLRDLTAGLNPEDFEGDDGGWGDDGSPTTPETEERTEPPGEVIIDYIDKKPLENWKPGADPDKNGNTGNPGDVKYNGEWMDAQTARDKVADDEFCDKRDKARRDQQDQEFKEDQEIKRQERNAEADRLTAEYEQRQAAREAETKRSAETRKRNRDAMIRRLSEDADTADRVRYLQSIGAEDEIERLYSDKMFNQMSQNRKELRYWEDKATKARIGEVGSKILLAGSKAAMMTVGGAVGIAAAAVGVGTISATQEGYDSYDRGHSATRVVGSTIVGFLSGAKDGALGAWSNVANVSKYTKLFVPAVGDTAESYLKARRDAGYAPVDKDGKSTAEGHGTSLLRAGGTGLLSIGSSLLGDKIDASTVKGSFTQEGAKVALSTVSGGVTSVMNGGTFGEGAQEGLIGGIGARAGDRIGGHYKAQAEKYEKAQREADLEQGIAESRASEEGIKSAMKGNKLDADDIPLDKQPKIIKQLGDPDNHHQEVRMTTENVFITDENGNVKLVQRQRIPTTLEGEMELGKYTSAHRTLDQLSDPASSQTAKGAPQEVQDVIMNTRRDLIYEPANNETIKNVAPELVKRGLIKPGDRLVVAEFSTPKQNPDGSIEPVKVGADRDARMLIEHKDATTGKVTYSEVDSRIWAPRAREDFFNHGMKLVGGEDAINSQNQPKYFDRLREAKSEDIAKIEAARGGQRMSDREILAMADDKTKHECWAESKNQVFTDRFHVEAGRDVSDHRMAIVDGRPMMVKEESNVLKVARGETTLEDATGMALQYPAKSRPYTNIDPQEGVSQTQKGIDMLMKMREGYRKQGCDVAPLKDRDAAAMELFQRTPKGADCKPSDITNLEKGLEDLGYGTHGRPPITDAQEKLAGQFEVLHKFSRPAVGPAPDLGTSADTSRVARSVLPGQPSPEEPSRVHEEPLFDEKPFSSAGIGMDHKPVSPRGSPREPQYTPEPARGIPAEPAGPAIRHAAAATPDIKEPVTPRAYHEQPSEPAPKSTAEQFESQTEAQEIHRGIEGMGRPVEGMGRPVEGMGRPVEGMGRPVEGMGRPVEGMGRPVEGMGRPVEGMGRPVEGMGRPVEGMGRPVEGMGRPVEGMGRPVEGMGRPVEGMGRPVEGMGRPVEGMGRTPEGFSSEQLHQQELRQSGLQHEGLQQQGLSSEGLSSEGLQHQGLSSQNLQQSQLMREELAQAREELAKQREELARLQEEMRKWREQNEK